VRLFPRECLAVAWAHIEYPEIFEKNLLGHYELFRGTSAVECRTGS
jgi:hypothetical protein